MKWSGKHVPNSPFNVHIFKTKEEYEKFLGTVTVTSDQKPKESFRLDESSGGSLLNISNSNTTTTTNTTTKTNTTETTTTTSSKDNNNILIQRI